MLISVSALIFTVFIGIVILFQLLLAAGMPWGSAAMGGKYPGKLPPAMRVTALVQIVILLLFAFIVLSAAQISFPEWTSFSASAVWFVVVFFVISTFLNLITRSVWERQIWAPVAVILLITSFIVAIG